MWIPTNTSICVQLNRPNPEVYYILPSILVTVLIWLLFLVAIPIHYLLRNEPRFYKIRNFGITTAFNVCFLLYAPLALLPETEWVYFPCEFTLFIHISGIASVACVVAFRMLSFILETRYAELLLDRNETNHIQNKHTIADSIYSMYILLYKSPESLRLQQIVWLKNSLSKWIGGIFLLPYLLMALFIGWTPMFRSGCTNCFMYTEFLLIVEFSNILLLPILLPLVYHGNKIRSDEQHVMYEIFLLVLIPGNLSFLSKLILAPIDPGNLMLERFFNWELLNVIGAEFGYFFISYGISFLAAIKSKKGRIVHPVKSSNNHTDFLDRLNDDIVLKMEFFSFAANRFCMESLNFVEDTKSFKLEISKHQSRSWKEKQCKKMIKLYVADGSLQEINISNDQRKKITNVDITVATDEKLDILFDEAYLEVSNMLASGTWMDFQIEKRKQHH